MRINQLFRVAIIIVLLPACNLFGFYEPEQSSLPTTMQELTFSGVSPDAKPGYEQIEARTRDGEPIYIDVTLLYRIDPAMISQIQQQGGENYPIVLLKPIVQSVIQDETARYSAREIYEYQPRTEWIENMRQELNRRLLEKGFFYSDFLIRNIQFTKKLTTEIELEEVATMTAEAQQPTTIPTP